MPPEPIPPEWGPPCRQCGTDSLERTYQPQADYTGAEPDHYSLCDRCVPRMVVACELVPAQAVGFVCTRCDEYAIDTSPRKCSAGRPVP